MFTVEFESDATVITTLDQAGELNDVEVILDEDSIFFRQWSDDMGSYDLVEMSEQQLRDIIAALSKPEGAYYAS
jgi:hypothetical protein